VPALKPKPFADNEKLVNISELPDWAQPAFTGESRDLRSDSGLPAPWRGMTWHGVSGFPRKMVLALSFARDVCPGLAVC